MKTGRWLATLRMRSFARQRPPGSGFSGAGFSDSNRQSLRLMERSHLGLRVRQRPSLEGSRSLRWIRAMRRSFGRRGSPTLAGARRRFARSCSTQNPEQAGFSGLVVSPVIVASDASPHDMIYDRECLARMTTSTATRPLDVAAEMLPAISACALAVGGFSTGSRRSSLAPLGQARRGSKPSSASPLYAHEKALSLLPSAK
jgi:hypothetical protein